MPAFNYTALDRNGKQKKGVIEADSSRQVRQKVREQGLTPISVDMVSEKSARGKTPKGKRISVADLALATRQMATLLSAGLPVEEMLLAVSEQTEKNHVKSVLIGVRSKVLEGHTLANGMNDFPKAFPKLYRATVAAGEQSGHLDKILNRLADYIEKQQSMKQKITQALIYPSLMTVVSISIVIFLLIYVVPKIIGVFSETQQSIPTLTAVLLAFSHGVQVYGIYILILLILAGLGFRQLLKKDAFRYRFHLVLLRIPILGNTLKVINSARFARTFGILFAATVPVLEAMRVACDLISILPMQQAVADSINKVREGTAINMALKQSGYFAPMSIHLIASGEASGQLEQMLEKTADNQDNDVAVLITNLLTLFEPLLIIVMGSVVLFIVLAVLLPIFQLDVIAGQS